MEGSRSPLHWWQHGCTEWAAHTKAALWSCCGSVLGGHCSSHLIVSELWGAWKGKIKDHRIEDQVRTDLRDPLVHPFRVSPFLTAVKPGAFVSLLWCCVTASVYNSEAKHLPWFFLTYFKFFWLLKGQEGDARQGLALWEMGYVRGSGYPKLLSFLAPGAWLHRPLWSYGYDSACGWVRLTSTGSRSLLLGRGVKA